MSHRKTLHFEQAPTLQPMMVILKAPQLTSASKNYHTICVNGDITI